MENDSKLTNPNSLSGGLAEPAPAIKWGWLRALLILPAWVLALIVVGFIGYLGYGITGLEDNLQLLNTPAGLILQLLQLLGTVVPIFLFRRFLDRRSFVSLGLRFSKEFRKDLLAGMAWGVGIITVVFVVLRVTGGIEIVGVRPPGVSLAIITLAMIMVGFSEELMMRGYVQGNLMTSMDKYAALLITSLLFSAMHIFNPNMSWAGLVNIILAGLLLGIYYVHKRNLWFPVGLHFTWNLFQGSVYGSQVSGVSIDSMISIEVVGSDLLTGGSFGFEASLVTTAVIVASIITLHLVHRPRST